MQLRDYQQRSIPTAPFRREQRKKLHIILSLPRRKLHIILSLPCNLLI